MEKKQLEIGDKVRETTCFSITMFTIVRVTKTKAVGTAKSSLGGIITVEFKRAFSDFSGIKTFHPIAWDRTKYELLTE